MCTVQNLPAQHGRPRRLVVTVALLLEALLLTACAGSAEPEKNVVDRGRLTKQINEYLDPDASFDGVRAVVVRAAGEPVVEIYRETDSETYWDVESVTKSVISILVGIALDEGHLDDMDQTLAELLPAHAAQMSLQVAEATLGQVLTMRAGFSGFFDDPNAYIDRTPQGTVALGHRVGPAQQIFLSAASGRVPNGAIRPSRSAQGTPCGRPSAAGPQDLRRDVRGIAQCNSAPRTRLIPRGSHTQPAEEALERLLESLLHARRISLTVQSHQPRQLLRTRPSSADHAGHTVLT